MEQNNKEKRSKKGLIILVSLIILIIAAFALYKYTNISDILNKYMNGDGGSVRVAIVDNANQAPVNQTAQPTATISATPVKTEHKEIALFKNEKDKCSACALQELIALDSKDNAKKFKVDSDSKINDEDLANYNIVYGIANNMLVEPTELKEGENKIMATEIKGKISTKNAYLDTVTADGSHITYTFSKLVPLMQTKLNDMETIWVKVKVDDNYYLAGGLIEQVEKNYDLDVDWGSLITIVEGASNDNIEFIIK